MAASTTTTFTEIVPSEFIDPLIMDYLMDPHSIAQFVYEVDMRNMPGLTANMTRWISDAASGVDITTEGTTDMTSVAFETQEVTATAAPVGILRELTELTLSATVLGEAGLEFEVARDGGKIMRNMLDDDLAALFVNLNGGTSVGTTTLDLTLANLVTAIGTRRANNARGPAVFILDDQAATDAQNAQLSSTATVFTNPANSSLLEGKDQGFIGTFLGHRVYSSSLTDTANGGADVVSALITVPEGPEGTNYATLGMVTKWDPRVKSEDNVSKLTQEYAVSACYGVTERYDGTGIPIVTDA